MSEDRVVVITGTSSGIGLHTAVAAARAGWRVVATLRDPNRGDRLRAAASDAGVELDIRALDVVVDGAAKRVLDDLRWCDRWWCGRRRCMTWGRGA